jgi:archaellum component FlaC
MDNVLFVSNPGPQCGVHQFGKATATALAKSNRFNFVYVECSDSRNTAEFLAALQRFTPVAVIYNWHPSTMPWLSEHLLVEITRLLPHSRHAAIVHDYKPPFSSLCAIIHSDPTFQESRRDFRVGRLIPSYTPKGTAPRDAIGSFGFGFGNKGFPRLVQQVNSEFETATVRLHIPYALYGDADGKLARQVAEECRQSAKAGIAVEVTHDFMETADLLDWLAGNTINCFFYDRLEGRGISSVLDLALGARRLIAITNSWMFRHVVDATPTILIERSSLRQIIANGIKPLEPFYQMWSEENLIRDYERVVDSMLRTTKYNLTSNRVLTPLDREQLEPVVEELTFLAPEIMSRKIPQAVFQNAFIFQQVKNSARKTDRIIVIGGYEDPIGPALQKLGYNVEISDPQLDGRDMETVWMQSQKFGIEYDIVISCSVLEHVDNDAEFIRQMYQILKPGGTAFLTADYLENWTEGMSKPNPDLRLYTSERLRYLVSQLPADCLTDPPTWGDQSPYFQYESAKYGFCSLAFRRRAAVNDFDEFVRNEFLQQLQEQRHRAEEYYRQLQGLQRQADEYHRQLQEFQHEADGLRGQLEETRRDAETLQEHLRRAEAERGAVAQETNALRRRLAEESRIVAELHRTVDEMYKSLSMRVTAPLRAVKHRFPLIVHACRSPWSYLVQIPRQTVRAAGWRAVNHPALRGLARRLLRRWPRLRWRIKQFLLVTAEEVVSRQRAGSSGPPLVPNNPSTRHVAPSGQNPGGHHPKDGVSEFVVIESTQAPVDTEELRTRIRSESERRQA